MSSVSDDNGIVRHGTPALFVRAIGWAILGFLAAFLINNVLVVGFDFAGIRGVWSGGGATAWINLAIAGIGIALAVAYVFATPNQALRWDARRIHGFNVYLIRALFWSVFFIGLFDAGIAFMRVESLFDFAGDDFVRSMSKASFVGVWVHMPLLVFAFIFALFTRTLGFTWLALLIVAAELLIVISRFVFSYEQAMMGDLVRYWYAALFLFASAYTLFDEGHVRVDIVYAGLARRQKGTVNAVGTLFLGMSTVWVIIAIGLNGKQSIINSPVANFEISQAGGVGMFVKYQMAAFLALFAITMLIQFVSYFFEAVADRREEPGHRDVAQAAH